MFTDAYGSVYDGDDRWNSLDVSTGDRYQWDDTSTYVHRPPFFDDIPLRRRRSPTSSDARCLAKLGDSITTDHISPAGSIAADSPAGEWLVAHGVAPTDFNSYGSRRGQPRGHDPRDVRERPAPQPARPGHRRRLDPFPSPAASR